MGDLFEESERLVVELLQLIDVPTIDSLQVQISDTACSLALEHWHAVRSLLQLGLLPSALVVHRSQFEALVRSVWLAYAACNSDLAKLTATLDLESEQAAKNIPTVNVMMQHIQEKAPAARIQRAGPLQRAQLEGAQFLYTRRYPSLASARRWIPGSAVERRAVQCKWSGRHELHAGSRALGGATDAAAIA